MNDYALDLHGQMLLEEYHEMLPVFKQLQQVVMERLKELFKQSGIELNSM